MTDTDIDMVTVIIGGLIAFISGLALYGIKLIVDALKELNTEVKDLSAKHATILDKVSDGGRKLAEHTQDIYHLQKDVNDLKTQLKPSRP